MCYLRKIEKIINCYVDDDFQSFGHSVKDIVEAIYSSESVVWKFQSGDKSVFRECEKDFIVSTSQPDIFRNIFQRHKNTGGGAFSCAIMACDICMVIERERLLGTYSDNQATVMIGRLLTDFDLVARDDFEYRAGLINPESTIFKLCDKFWPPYEKYMISVGQIKPETHHVHHQGDGSVLEQLAHEDIKKTGCSVFLLLPVVAVLCKILFS